MTRHGEGATRRVAIGGWISGVISFAGNPV